MILPLHIANDLTTVLYKLGFKVSMKQIDIGTYVMCDYSPISEYKYEIRNLREILHNICAKVNLLHGHFRYVHCTSKAIARRIRN